MSKWRARVDSVRLRLSTPSGAKHCRRHVPLPSRSLRHCSVLSFESGEKSFLAQFIHSSDLAFAVVLGRAELRRKLRVRRTHCTELVQVRV
jgi:hypothetical protein